MSLSEKKLWHEISLFVSILQYFFIKRYITVAMIQDKTHASNIHVEIEYVSIINLK